jgi:hypothetical protein
MREPATTARVALYDRLKAPDQPTQVLAERELPPYLESFLAHLRLLVGVPMEYLVPDDRMLPPESIRFFYIDRSWTDRLVDGALAVGQIGSREQAHYQAHSETVSQTLDLSERMVRSLQRRVSFEIARSASRADARPADVITGFILRSSAVNNWPHMDVRAYDSIVDEHFKSADASVLSHQLKTLRLERIAPAVLVALFEGEPQMVILEEPHHGVQFGVRQSGQKLVVSLRDPFGQEVPANPPPASPVSIPVTVPVRPGHNDVVRINALRQALVDSRTTHPSAVDQTGSAALAISLLDPPFRQHFQGTVDYAETGAATPGRLFVSVAETVREPALVSRIGAILAGH